MPMKIFEKSIVAATIMAYLSGRPRENELSVKSPRPPESWVNGIYPVGGSDHYDLPSTVQAVH